MKLKVIQNEWGKFNFANPSQESMVFSLGIYDDENNLVKEGDLKCILYYCGDQDLTDDFENPWDNLAWVFEKCWHHATTTWGTTDYKAQCLLFKRVYSNFFQGIAEDYIKLKKEALAKKIKEMQDELDHSFGLVDFTEELDEPLLEEINRLEKWIADGTAEMDQFKDEAEGRIKIQKRVEGYILRLDDLKKSLNKKI